MTSWWRGSWAVSRALVFALSLMWEPISLSASEEGRAYPAPIARPSLEFPVPTIKADRQDASEAASSPGVEQPKVCPAVLQGHAVATYKGPILTEEGCGEASPLRVTAVHGVDLSPPALLNCRMVTTVADWVQALKDNESSDTTDELAHLTVSASYVCRRRNNKPDGKFSEHATMNAIDVSGFAFKSGRSVTVADHWDEGEHENGGAAFLRRAHKAACARFSTVLGPNSDQFHQSHFHLDLGCHGKTCTFRICQ